MIDLIVALLIAAAVAHVVAAAFYFRAVRRVERLLRERQDALALAYFRERNARAGAYCRENGIPTGVESLDRSLIHPGARRAD